MEIQTTINMNNSMVMKSLIMLQVNLKPITNHALYVSC